MLHRLSISLKAKKHDQCNLMILSYWLLHHIVETRWIYLIITNTCNGISYWKHKNRYITNREYPKSAIYVWGANYDCHANVYEMANLIRALKQWVILTLLSIIILTFAINLLSRLAVIFENETSIKNFYVFKK